MTWLRPKKEQRETSSDTAPPTETPIEAPIETTQLASSQPAAEAGSNTICYTNESRAPDALRRCRCLVCGLELVVTSCYVHKWRMNRKRAADKMEVGRCPTCRRSCNSLGRKLGTWPVAGFERLSQQSKEDFYLSIANKGTGEQVETLINHLTKQRIEYAEAWTLRDWKPLDVWVAMGHSKQQILEHAKDQEERYNNVGERTYMIKFESSRTGKIEQETRVEIYKLIAKADKKQKTSRQQTRQL